MLRTIVALVVFVALALGVCWYFGLDWIVEQAIETAGPALTGTTVEVDEVDLSIFDGRGTVRGVIIGNPSGFDSQHAFKLREARVHLAPLSVFREKTVIREIAINRPDIHFERKDGTSNLERISKHIQAKIGSGKKADPDPEEPIWESLGNQKLQIDRFVLREARVHVHGEARHDESLDVPAVSIELTGLGASPDGTSIIRVAAKVMKRITMRVTLAVTKQALTFGQSEEHDEVDQARESARERRTRRREERR